MSAGGKGPVAPVEAGIVGVGAAYVGGAGTTWVSGRLAAWLTGGQLRGGLLDAATAGLRLVRAPGDPSAAWGDSADGLPSAGPYWACTIAVWAVTVAAAISMVTTWRRRSGHGRRLGVRAEARMARRWEVRPLVVPSSVPPEGRMLLGRLAPRGPWLATEDRVRHPMRGRAARRQGNRGSVALIGPTQSGKTKLLTAAIAGWAGPVVALSVKRDLYDSTAAARADMGELAVFDPAGVSGLASARWSPLQDVTTPSGALRAGRALAQAIPRSGVTGADFWAAHGEAFISAYFSIAGLSQLLPQRDGSAREPLTIERLATWAYMGVGITDPLVNELLRQGLDAGEPLQTRLLARNAATKLLAHHREDPRIRGSIYATARLAFEAWTDPSVAHASGLDPRRRYDSDEDDCWPHRPRWVDLDWLEGDPHDGHANTLYLSVPDTEFERLGPVLGGLLGHLREQLHLRDIEGRPLTKPVLFVVDEAGQLDLAWLPGEVSTIAGLGAMLVTCWQSKTQITHRYDKLADAVLGGHRSKVFFPGIDDPATVDYLTKVAGAHHVPQRSWSAEVHGGHRSVSEQPRREDLVPGHVIRQLAPNDAVLVHGTLPPVHLRLVDWWRDPQLRRRIPTGGDTRPVPPTGVATCPLAGEPADEPRPVPDPAIVEDPARRLASHPGPVRGTKKAGTARPAAGRSPSATGTDQVGTHRTLPDNVRRLDARADGDRDESRPNRVAGVCERCAGWVPVGVGTSIRVGGRDWLRCATCAGTRPPQAP